MKLIEWMKKSDKTFKDIAIELKLDSSTIRKYANGTRVPALHIINKIDAMTDGKVSFGDFLKNK